MHAPRLRSGTVQHRRQIDAPTQPAVRRVRHGEERVLARTPVERSGVDDDAAKASAMPAQPLGQRVDHDVRTERDRLRQVRRRERGVHDQRNANSVRLLGDCLEVDDLQGGVGARLAEEGARLVIRRRRKGFGVGCVHKAHLDAKLGQDVLEHRVRAAVQGFRRDDVVTTRRDVDDRIVHRRRTRGKAEAAEWVRALEHRDALLKDIGRRVHQSGVDVAELSEGEELGRVVGGLEDKG